MSDGGHFLTRLNRSIEHGNYLDGPTASLMAEKGAFLVPTLVTYEVGVDQRKCDPPGVDQRKLKQSGKHFCICVSTFVGLHVVASARSTCRVMPSAAGPPAAPMADPPTPTHNNA